LLRCGLLSATAQEGDERDEEKAVEDYRSPRRWAGEGRG